jgi:hypothetical protein
VAREPTSTAKAVRKLPALYGRVPAVEQRTLSAYARIRLTNEVGLDVGTPVWAIAGYDRGAAWGIL